ncbi:MAG: TIGR02300 family protein [Holosporales bacterium]|jgi:uncharacterized protein (TIGR02300 family)|nr:TIGR02300 family protein [Holosporales bacterium]
MSAKPEWGRRRVCVPCGARFYDFKKNPILCPRCGEEFDPEFFLKRRVKGGETSSFDEDLPADIETAEEALGLAEPSAEGEEVLEDAEDLSGEEADDVSFVRESSCDDERE